MSIFLDFAEKVISEEKKELTYSEIWNIGEKKGYIKELNTKGLTPLASLRVALKRDVRDNPDTKFSIISEDPNTYYLKSLPPSNQSPIQFVQLNFE
jgi:hypothetical protein